MRVLLLFAFKTDFFHLIILPRLAKTIRVSTPAVHGIIGDILGISLPWRASCLTGWHRAYRALLRSKSFCFYYTLLKAS